MTRSNSSETSTSGPDSAEKQSENSNHTQDGSEINEVECSEDYCEESEAEGSVVNEASEAQKEIESLKKDLAATQDKYLRSLADFENFKKRAQKERSELLKYQGEQIVVDLIRVIDDLDLAIQFKDADPEKFRQGIEYIYKGLCDVLNKWDIRAESSLGKLFDPVKHLAISRIASEDAAVGTVVSELKKVFFYKDKMIRVGEVVVATEQGT